MLSDGAELSPRSPPTPTQPNPPYHHHHLHLQSLTLIISEEQSDAQEQQEQQQQHARTLPGECGECPPSNMFPARRRGRRTGGSTVPPRTVVTAGRTGQVGQVWVSCWILLSATCILSARAQGKMRNSENDFFFLTLCFCWERTRKEVPD